MVEKRPITIPGPQGPLDVIFSEATTPEDRTQCSKLAATAFRKFLSEDEYLEREAYLGDHPLARGTRLRFWSLTLAGDPLQVLALCKTLHRDLLVRDDEGMRVEQGYCICSVATNPQYRGRGLAPAVLRNVAEWMDGPGQATASMLYSDVGEFYVSKGWDVLDTFQSTLTVPSSIPPLEQRAKLPKTRLLTADDEISSLCAHDVEDLKDEFRKSDLLPGNTLMTVLPTPDMIDWLHSRVDFMNIKSVSKTPEKKGSICSSAGSWLYWFHDLHYQTLTIQRVKLPKNQGGEAATQVLAALLLDALEEAAAWKSSKVVIWNPSPELHSAMKLLATEFGIEVVNEKRESLQIPCIRWRGGEKKLAIVLPTEYYGWS
ncbi:hypothetical protein F4804DRAFT_212889 [Jackrogersella minutella]|nr:hypothetical protein F4804DRAFT_212889 [Jackrogersella minutella]